MGLFLYTRTVRVPWDGSLPPISEEKWWNSWRSDNPMWFRSNRKRISSYKWTSGKRAFDGFCAQQKLPRNGHFYSHAFPISRAEAFWESASSSFQLVNKVSDKKRDDGSFESELLSNARPTFETKTPKGRLSPAAIISVEQFSRLNGSTGKQIKALFDSVAPVAVQNDARNLVEYCCFRFLARTTSDFHPYIKDAAFRRLIFITMLAWQRPYSNDMKDKGVREGNENAIDEEKLPRLNLVGEAAFVRIAPAISGTADSTTAHFLFKVLTCDSDGLSFAIWDKYLVELCRVHGERKQYKETISTVLGLYANECVLCIGANKRQPIQKWTNNITWPGRLTLTNQAIYYEANGLSQHQKAIRLDLRGSQASVSKTMVGPFGSSLFDSAISIKSDPQSEPWVLEFVDFGKEQRRDLWHGFVAEIQSVYAFINEFGPEEGDPLTCYVHGAEDGRRKAISSAINGIARVQAVVSTLGRGIQNPEKLLQFCYLRSAPSGDLVLQSLAVFFWGGHLGMRRKDTQVSKGSNGNTLEDAFSLNTYIVDIDRSVYLRRWMRSPSWESRKSITFWKQKTATKEMILGKSLVVGQLSSLERAVKECRDQSHMVEKTRATIDGALLKGIPSNIDLLKELMLPLTLLSISFKRLKRWEQPLSTAAFLVSSLFIIYKDWLHYVFPTSLMMGAALVLTFRNLKMQGRLADDFGRVTIREQPPSNTLQKIIALKEALAEMELQIQKLNIILLKLRTVALTGHFQATNEVVLTLVATALLFYFIPFRYICAFIIIDQFTCELEFRREMVIQFMSRLKEWWDMIPASPVVVLPSEVGSADDTPSVESENALSETGLIFEASK